MTDAMLLRVCWRNRLVVAGQTRKRYERSSTRPHLVIHVTDTVSISVGTINNVETSYFTQRCR